MLKVNEESEDYRFYKTLNEDVELVHYKYGKFDIAIENGDFVIVTGHSSLYNAIVIAIMTRFNELQDIPLYEGFGCKVHELIKNTKSDKVYYLIELYVREVLENMRRISEINELIVTDSQDDHYTVYFNVTSITDEIVAGEVDI